MSVRLTVQHYPTLSGSVAGRAGSQRQVPGSADSGSDQEKHSLLWSTHIGKLYKSYVAGGTYYCPSVFITTDSYGCKSLNSFAGTCEDFLLFVTVLDLKFHIEERNRDTLWNGSIFLCPSGGELELDWTQECVRNSSFNTGGGMM